MKSLEVSDEVDHYMGR